MERKKGRHYDLYPSKIGIRPIGTPHLRLSPKNAKILPMNSFCGMEVLNMSVATLTS